MSTVNIVLLVILAVLIVGLIVLYFLGKKAQKKRDEQEAQLAANAQTVSMLIIDKKRMRPERFGTSAGCHRPDTEDDAPFQASNRKGKGWSEGDVTDRRRSRL